MLLIFLRQSTCYVITPHTHQLYILMQMKYSRIKNGIMWWSNMVPLAPPKLPPINAFMTTARLTLLQAQDGQIIDNHK